MNMEIYSAEILFFARVKYNPLPLFGAVLATAVVVSVLTLPLVHFWRNDDLKRKVCFFYASVAFFAGLYGVLGLLYAVFVAVSRYVGSDKYGKQLLWFDSLVSLTVFLAALTIFALLLGALVMKIEPPPRGSKAAKRESAATETDFTSLKLGD